MLCRERFSDPTVFIHFALACGEQGAKVQRRKVSTSHGMLNAVHLW